MATYNDVGREDLFTHEYLLENLHYNPGTGIFWWKKPGSGRDLTKPAGSISEKGYRRIKIRPRSYMAHRLAWFYMTGNWPEFQIDHIDLNKDNNKIDNLREASRTMNAANAPARGKLKVKGVSERNGKYKVTAYDSDAKKFAYLGTYSTIEEASETYQKFAKEKYGEFMRA